MIRANPRTYNRHFLEWAELYLETDLSCDYELHSNRRALNELSKIYETFYKESPYIYNNCTNFVNFLEKLFESRGLSTKKLPRTFEEVNKYIIKVYESAIKYANKPEEACSTFFRECNIFKKAYSEDQTYDSFLGCFIRTLQYNEKFIAYFLYDVLEDVRPPKKAKNPAYTYIHNKYELIFHGISSTELTDTDILIHYGTFSEILESPEALAASFSLGKALVDEAPGRYKPCLFAQQNDGYLKLLFPKIWDEWEWRGCLHGDDFYVFLWDTYDRTFVVNASLNLSCDVKGDTSPARDVGTLLGYTPTKLEILAENLLRNVELETLPLREKIRKPKKYIKSLPL